MASKAAQPNSIPTLKKLVRASMAKTLQGLATAHIEDASRAALKKLLSLPQVQKAQHVAAFASMEKEVQTNSMVFTLLSRGKHVLLPRVLGRRSMAFREVSLAHTADDSSAVASGSSAQMAASPASSAPQLSDDTEGNNISAAKLAELLGLETSKWGIREPVLPAPSGTSVDVDTVCEARGVATAPLDVVLVPCVAFGREGARLGHGGGFYGALQRSRSVFLPDVCFTLPVLKSCAFLLTLQSPQIHFLGLWSSCIPSAAGNSLGSSYVYATPRARPMCPQNIHIHTALASLCAGILPG